MTSNKLPITYYVLEPREEPCCQVNPHLWREFTAINQHLFEDNHAYTEAYCVQWLDMYYYEHSQDKTAAILV